MASPLFVGPSLFPLAAHSVTPQLHYTTTLALPYRPSIAASTTMFTPNQALTAPSRRHHSPWHPHNTTMSTQACSHYCTTTSLVTRSKPHYLFPVSFPPPPYSREVTGDHTSQGHLHLLACWFASYGSCICHISCFVYASISLFFSLFNRLLCDGLDACNLKLVLSCDLVF